MKSNDRTFVVVFLVGVPVVVLALLAYLVWGVGERGVGTYAKLVHKPEKALVMGTSYAARGIVPSVVNAARLPFDGPLYNFAFTNGNSQWGPAYYKAVKLLLDPSTTNGLFLVQSNPRGFTVSKKGGQSADEAFVEDNRFLGQIEKIRAAGFLAYTLDSLSIPFYQLFWANLTGTAVENVQPDGWLLINLKQTDRDRAEAARRKYITYEKELETDAFSERRWEWFVRLVEFLDSHGTVFFVRLPSTDRHAEIEDQLSPGFDERVQALAASMGTSYLNYKGTHRDYLTSDGAHLVRQSSNQFTEELVQDISRLHAPLSELP